VCGVNFFKREESEFGPGKVGAGILKKGQETTSLFFFCRSGVRPVGCAPGFLVSLLVRRWRCCVCVGACC